MAGSVNKVIIVGNLGRDPEVRNFQNGGKVVNLRIATSENWKDRNTGERKERTEWHSVAIFSEPLGRIAEQYLRKGSKVYIEGQLETRKWQDQSGQDRYSTEVVLAATAADRPRAAVTTIGVAMTIAAVTTTVAAAAAATTVPQRAAASTTKFRSEQRSDVTTGAGRWSAPSLSPVPPISELSCVGHSP